METLQLKATIGPDRVLHIDAPSTLPPGPVEVVVVVSPASTRDERVDWCDAYGLGKEIWKGVDAQAYVNELRDEWER